MRALSWPPGNLSYSIGVVYLHERLTGWRTAALGWHKWPVVMCITCASVPSDYISGARQRCTDMLNLEGYSTRIPNNE